MLVAHVDYSTVVAAVREDKNVLSDVTFSVLLLLAGVKHGSIGVDTTQFKAYSPTQPDPDMEVCTCKILNLNRQIKINQLVQRINPHMILYQKELNNSFSQVHLTPCEHFFNCEHTLL